MNSSGGENIFHGSPLNSIMNAKIGSLSTFSDNNSLPVYSWFKFPAGFSGSFAYREIRRYSQTNNINLVLDPFAGVGTTVLSGEIAGVKAVGIEAHPFTAKVAKAKLYWTTEISDFELFANEVIEKARNMNASKLDYPELIWKCYSEETLRKLHNLRISLEEKREETPEYALSWLALVSILRPTAKVGTSNIELIQPKKIKKNPLEPYSAMNERVRSMIEDMKKMRSLGALQIGTILQGDARNCDGVADRSVDLVITSPPYLNNFDYADAVRFEMSFMKEVNGWSDLTRKVRKRLVVSCAQQTSSSDFNLESALDDLSTATFYDDFLNSFERLRSERTLHGGRKNYHLMVAGYFSDMKKVWRSLRRVSHDGTIVKFVVGDSAPYGIYIPVERWLGELALESGFVSYSFEKLRDRNVKWRNRKHKVPLKEGILTVEG